MNTYILIFPGRLASGAIMFIIAWFDKNSRKINKQIKGRADLWKRKNMKL